MAQQQSEQLEREGHRVRAQLEGTPVSDQAATAGDGFGAAAGAPH
jgi:hypothetical protein